MDSLTKKFLKFFSFTKKFIPLRAEKQKNNKLIK